MGRWSDVQEQIQTAYQRCDALMDRLANLETQLDNAEDDHKDALARIEELEVHVQDLEWEKQRAERAAEVSRNAKRARK